MSLFFHLILRLAAVVTVCLACAAGWVLVDTHRAIEAETAATADRVAHDLENLYWQGLLWRDGLSRDALLPAPDWETLRTGRLLAPGVCVTFAPDRRAPHTVCGRVEGVGTAAPAWFAAAYGLVFDATPPVTRGLTVRQPGAGHVVATADPGAAMRQAWGQISAMVGVAALMAVGIGLFAAALIGQALVPARTIVAGLRRLEDGDYRHRLPEYRMAEFSHIARAVNDLTSRLEQTTADRAALTKRLFQVQEEERRALARDLHDEFGQCLTAAGALAAAIALDAAADRPRLANDARSITRLVARMMTTVRQALARLRSQEIEELGLEASLAQLIGGWNAQTTPQAVFHLAVTGDLAAVPGQTALNIYRIAQECLTNAARHGRPSDVYLRVERAEADGEVALTVEDDGGGDPARINAASGHGILGIRERIAALGGSLSICRAARGIRIAATIPLTSPALP